MFPTLETERLRLREIVNKDAQGIFNCFSNNDVTRYYGQDPITTKVQAEQFVEHFAKNYKEKKELDGGLS